MKIGQSLNEEQPLGRLAGGGGPFTIPLMGRELGSLFLIYIDPTNID